MPKPIYSSDLTVRDVLLPPPTTRSLPDIPGGEENLLPANTWMASLKVDVSVWPDHGIEPGDRESLSLYWDEKLIQTKVWTQPIPVGARFIMVPVLELVEGEHVLRYEVMQINGHVMYSHSMVVTIDKTAPDLALLSALQFPLEAINDGVTDALLVGSSERLDATVPGYDAKPGDVILFYWSRVDAQPEPAGEKTLSFSDMDLPATISFTGEVIRGSGDGQRFASYQVRDRSGNISARSAAVELLVNLQPVLSLFPRPIVELAESVGETGTLDPLLATDGVLVKIPASATIEVDDEITLKWVGSGTTGSYETVVATPEGSWNFTVPPGAVPANFGKTVDVYYTVKKPGNDEPYESDHYSLLIARPPIEENYSLIWCIEAPGSADLEISSSRLGAHFRVDKWLFMAAGQRIWMRIEGVRSNGDVYATSYRTGDPISAWDVTEGFYQILWNVDQLKLMKIDEPFTVYFSVQYDASAAVVEFPSLVKTLVD